MSSSQTFPNQPIAVPQPLQLASVVPFSNALPSAPPAAKKMWRVAFECSTRLQYPSISITDRVPTSFPTGLQPIYEDAYLANSSPKVLDRVDVEEWRNIFGSYPSCEYCKLHNLHSSCSLCPNSLSCGTCEANYPSSKKFCSFKSIFRLLQFHILAKLPLFVAYCIVSSRGLFPIREELGLSSDRLRTSEGKRKAVISSNAFQKSQLLREERVHLGEPSCELIVLTSSRKGKEVVCDTADVDVEMGALEELDTMTLDYPEEVPPPPVPVLTPPAPVWKAIDNRSYREVSGLKTWFFKPLIKRDPSDNSSTTRDEMIRTAIERVIMRIAELLSGPGKKILEQDLWALADGMVQGVFNELEEQLNHPSSEPPVLFLNSGLIQFEYQALSQKSDCLEAENLRLQEQVISHDSQLKDKDEELTRLKSFVRHFMGDVQSTEVQQLRGAMEARDGEIEELKEKLAASEEAHRVAAEESKLRDEELAQLWQLFESVRGQFAAASPSKPSSSSDIQSMEVQQLRGAMEARDGEIEELKKKLAASEEARRVAAEELKSRDEELAQLRQLFESVQGQFAAASPSKPSSSSL
ncbi:hypothetical protein GYMLUDRAFT_251399 [Collybiopsis luxurians FD-317 M1]|uniref:Uncharacterized protein n=1 Tax=Collybiopsis luxurians FD-317 M1 TaxID=944289 RepID=A0A0D0CBJ9_9AGAR|nr:hypothetical protein GYMLUDRAFT_251399 [Collybiopsis luxurians FD-317 M1]